MDERSERLPQVYQDYLPDESRPKTVEGRHRRWREVQRRRTPPTPRAGHGRLWVVPDTTGRWSAHWRDEDGHEGYLDVDGTVEEVRRWVDQQFPAAAIIHLPVSRQDVPLTDSTWLEGRRQVEALLADENCR